MPFRILVVALSLTVSTVLAFAHGGGLDANGCHNDRQRGGYHCHRGPLSGRSFNSRAEAERMLSGTPAPAARPSSPTPASGPAVSLPTPTPMAVAVPYDRDLYRYGIDADGDCLDTRHEVLLAESLVPATVDGCRVVSGLWHDPYTGAAFTSPADLEVDHFIPLAEVHRSGGDRWTREMREAYANDLFHTRGLMAVSSGANRSKGDRDPAGWLPPNEGYRCEYVRNWVVLKATWGLSMDAQEATAVRSVLQACS